MSENVDKGERLQKVLAQAGVGSRREVERWISEGRIEVNGEKATLGVRVVPKDRVYLDGKKVSALASASEQEYRVIVYSKPEGVICSRSDPGGRPTIFENLPKLKNQRWISVGRLDINTSGLLILTTDGELANRLMHPSYEVDREYAVRVRGGVDDEMMERLKEGVLLEDGMAKFTDLQRAGGDSSNEWFHAVLMEGKNREVRRLWESQGIQVSRLKRVRYGCIFLSSRLKVGAWEELNNKDVNELRSLVGMDPIRVKRRDVKSVEDDSRRHKRAMHRKGFSGKRSR